MSGFLSYFSSSNKGEETGKLDMMDSLPEENDIEEKEGESASLIKKTK